MITIRTNHEMITVPKGLVSTDACIKVGRIVGARSAKRSVVGFCNHIM